ncbi:alpha/beta fold hydrolase [Iamia sp.]|uniref:alpha/beta fold hydrolase n=1 Tax=Iamia sp. TaxID=2722710 RepID=UPI002B53BE24|nr:alpha/beta fold hydrolase [Iamia sp.]HXH59604.1 alpha/beta fold hydrolase [Iamia sp.]
MAAPPLPRRRSVRGDGVDLAVREWGDRAGPTTVLVHGYPDSSTVWDPLVAALLATEPGRHVVAYDVRGAGASSAPRSTAGYGAAHLVADLAAVIDATSPDAPVHLVGHDWGSVQSWVAVRSPEVAARIASFTSISGPALDHVERWVRAHTGWRRSQLGPLLRQAARSWYIACFRVPVVAPLVWRLVLAPAWPHMLRRKEGVETSPAWPGPGLARDAVNGLHLYRANGGDVGAGPLERTPVPVQILALIDDAYVTTALLAGLDDLSVDGWVRPVPGGHWVIRRDPLRVAQWIDDHIATVSSRP